MDSKAASALQIHQNTRAQEVHSEFNHNKPVPIPDGRREQE